MSFEGVGLDPVGAAVGGLEGDPAAEMPAKLPALSLFVDSAPAGAVPTELDVRFVGEKSDSGVTINLDSDLAGNGSGSAEVVGVLWFIANNVSGPGTSIQISGAESVPGLGMPFVRLDVYPNADGTLTGSVELPASAPGVILSQYKTGQAVTLTESGPFTLPPP